MGPFLNINAARKEEKKGEGKKREIRKEQVARSPSCLTRDVLKGKKRRRCSLLNINTEAGGIMEKDRNKY